MGQAQRSDRRSTGSRANSARRDVSVLLQEAENAAAQDSSAEQAVMGWKIWSCGKYPERMTVLA